MADLFGASQTQDTTNVSEDPIETVKQKFKTEAGELDVAGLAKGKVAADSHISNLEKELAGLRKELDTRLSYEQFLEEIKTSRQTTQGDNQTRTEEVKALGKDEIAAIVRDAYNQQRTQAQKDQNVREAVDALRKAWGSNYEAQLVEKLDALGISKEFAQGVAQASPAALLKLVEANVPRPTGPNLAPPQNQRSALQDNTGRRDWNYYEKLRKSNPGAYWSVSTQKQMHNDHFEQGEEFGIPKS